MFINQLIKLSLPALALALAACGPKVDNRGYVNDEMWKERITVGTTTKDDVLVTFGSPSVQSSFGEETWYYVSSRKETTAFLKPEVVKQDIVRVVFDAGGVVSRIETFDETSSKDFDVAKRITPTEGHQLGFFEQILGNIGRFNKPGSTGVPTGRRGGGGY